MSDGEERFRLAILYPPLPRLSEIILNPVYLS